MKITLEVPAHLEAPVLESLEGNKELAQRILEGAFASALQVMLAHTPPHLSDEEFDALMDEMDQEWEADGGPSGKVPADDIITREDIYRDHL